jgi:hypothetical protein
VTGTELQSHGRTLHFETHKLMVSIRSRKGLPQKWTESVIISIFKIRDKITVTIFKKSSCHILFNILLSQVAPLLNEILEAVCPYSVTMGEILIMPFVSTCIESGIQVNSISVIRDFKKAYI